MAYLSLLYPPLGSFHAPTLASSIVLVGDSSGAGLCLALLQLILHLRRQCSGLDPKIRFHGKDVRLPVPAGFAGLSTSSDLTHSQRSWVANAKYDVLPLEPTPIRASQPPCDIWPSTPPRGDIYCDLSAICHPLVSPTAAIDWTGAPPMSFACGQEMLADEGAVIARRAAQQGVCVVWEQFEGLPHSFVGYLTWLSETALCFKHWADFCLHCVQNTGEMITQGTFVGSHCTTIRAIDVTSIDVVTVEEARKIMADERRRRQQRFEEQSKFKARM